jgi:hypothetical protein
MSRSRTFLIGILKAVHFVVLIFVVMGWIFPYSIVWLAHFIFVPLMILQWQFNQGSCLLTNIEYYLRGDHPDKQRQQGQFIKSLISRCFDPLPPDALIKYWIYLIVGICWGLSGMRLLMVENG